MSCHLEQRIRTGLRSLVALPGTYDASVYCGSSLVKTYPTAVLSSTDGVSEYMIDEVLVEDPSLPLTTRCINLKKRNSNKLLFKNVEHYKVDRSFEQKVFNAVWQNKTTCTNYKLAIHSRWYHGRGYDTCAHFVPELQYDEYPVNNIAVYKAIDRMAPNIEDFLPTVNLWAIILELGQLKGLLGTFVINAKQHIVKTAADKHLNYNFGIVPVQSDLEKIYNIIEKLDSVIDKWNSFADASQIMDYHETVSNETSNVVAGDGYELPSSISTAAKVTSKYHYSSSKLTKVHAYGYAQRIPDSKRFIVMLQALGLDKPIAGIWEAVPFSWVIDYFVNVGDVIASWEKGLESMFQLKVISAGLSISKKYQCRVDFRDGDYPTSTYVGTLFESSIEETGSDFRRIRLGHQSLFSNARAQLVTESMRAGLYLGWKQATYLGAVAITRR